MPKGLNNYLVWIFSQAGNIVIVLVAMESVLHQFTKSFPPALLKPGFVCALDRRLHQAVKLIVSTWQKLLTKGLFPLVRMSKCLSGLFTSTSIWFCLWIFQVSCGISNYKTFWTCSKDWVIQFFFNWVDCLSLLNRKPFRSYFIFFTPTFPWFGAGVKKR